MVLCHKEIVTGHGENQVIHDLTINADRSSGALYYLFSYTHQKSGTLEQAFAKEISFMTKRAGRPKQQVKTVLPGDQFPSYVVIWGDIALVPLDSNEVSEYLSGNSRKGYLVDYSLNLPYSARNNLPIFSMIGGPGAILNYRVDNDGTQRLAIRLAVPDAFVPGSPSIAMPQVPPAPVPPPAAPRPAPPAQEAVSSGTGIMVSADGRVLTADHVVDKCDEILVRPSGDVFQNAVVVYQDKQNDLVLLKTEAHVAEQDVAAIRTAPPMRQGEDIAVYGYPLMGALSTSGNVTRGNVSALTGLQNDSRFVQITAPVQQGNSGGPLLDRSGNVIGVVVSKLDPTAVAMVTGDIPQNVNFALKSSVVTSFLEANGVAYRSATDGSSLDLPAITDIARRFTVLVACHVPPRSSAIDNGMIGDATLGYERAAAQFPVGASSR